MKIKSFHKVLLRFIEDSKFEDDMNDKVDLEFALHNIRDIYNEYERGGAE